MTVANPVRQNLGRILPTQLYVDKRMTSRTDPYRIIDVIHVEVDPSHSDIKGCLAISICPGKKDHKWNRDLECDLAVIKNEGIQVIVCLLEWAEMRTLGIADYPKRAQEEGFLFYHLPVKDRRAPLDKEVDALVPIIVNHLSLGDKVLVHCRGGLGRAGTICGCCLGHFGFNGPSAINLVRQQRPGAIQTKSQVTCVLNHCAALEKV